jgi:hypothetical protein
MEAIRFNVSGRREMRIRYELAYEFVKQGIWDEEDFMGFILNEVIETGNYAGWKMRIRKYK